jgi:hypothetical protein
MLTYIVMTVAMVAVISPYIIYIWNIEEDL